MQLEYCYINVMPRVVSILIEGITNLKKIISSEKEVIISYMSDLNSRDFLL